MVDEQLDIYTPENVAFGYQLAGIGSRFIAALADTLIIVLLQIIANLLLLLIIGPSLGAGLEARDSRALSWAAALIGLIAFGLLWGYYIFFEMWWNGQSPGKRLVGLRVIRSDGTPISLSEAIIRNLIRLVDFLPLYYGVGVITMFIDAQARRLGDLAAGTLVVYDRGALTLESLERRQTAAARAIPYLDAEFDREAPPLERLDARDVALANSFLERRYELENEAELALDLAQRLWQKMELPPRTLQQREALALLQAAAQRDQAPVRPNASPDPAR